MKKFLSTISVLQIIIALCLFTHSFAQDISIIPMPSSLVNKSGTFTLSSATTVSHTDQKEVTKVADYLRSPLQPSTGFSLTKSQSQNNVIGFEINEKADPKLGSEGYSLDVSPEKINIRANSPAGLF